MIASVASLPCIEAAFLVALAVPLAVATVTDIAERRIPDAANLAVALLGLARVLALDPASAADRLLDATLLAALLAALRFGYRALRGRTGLGLGDVKFLAAATLWTGLSGIALVLFVASVAALAFVAALRLAGRPIGRASRIAFGPFLAAALLVVLVADALMPLVGG